MYILRYIQFCLLYLVRRIIRILHKYYDYNALFLYCGLFMKYMVLIKMCYSKETKEMHGCVGMCKIDF